MRKLQGERSGKSLTVGVVVSRFNQAITDRLLDGAIQALEDAGVSPKKVILVSVPGAFELGWAAKQLVERKSPDAVVCLGAVIRGETEHFTYVCKAAQEGVLGVALSTGVPVTFGVLTTETVEQAMKRSTAGPSNKGYEAAGDAVELAGLYRALE